MDLKAKVIAIIFAIAAGLFIHFCFDETLKLEEETKDFKTATAEYENVSMENCSHGICKKKLYYKFPVKGNFYHISTFTMETSIPKRGSTKLVKYDEKNPNIAYFTKINIVYLYKLIMFFFAFVAVWIIFAKPPQKPDYSIYRADMSEDSIKNNEKGQTVISEKDTTQNANSRCGIEYRKQSDKHVLYESGVARNNAVSETSFHVGQALMGGLFLCVCLAFYSDLSKMIKTCNPFEIIVQTHPAGIVLIVLLVLSIIVIIMALQKNTRKTKFEKFDIKSNKQTS